MPTPIRPPIRTLPAMPAAPALAVLWVTVMAAGRYPGLVTVATNSLLRLIRIAHGVASQKWPFVVSTLAPIGSLLTSQASVEPRVTDAQAQSRTHADADTTKPSFMISPPVP
ncbi:hypothetical protein [Caulobacter sp. UC70_42]|uniref:hypothetical protein n=1 Tax=Caulobacter sp. UC70_42 TaxID=3374551 RepID=UPI0037583E5E